MIQELDYDNADQQTCMKFVQQGSIRIWDIRSGNSFQELATTNKVSFFLAVKPPSFSSNFLN